MKSLWNNFKVAFAMFSKIPMPRADWTKENMKYMFCFFKPFLHISCYTCFVVSPTPRQLGKEVTLLEPITSLIVSVMAGVICHLICKWLDEND